MTFVVVAPKKILAPLVKSLRKIKVAADIHPVLRPRKKKNNHDPYSVYAILAKRPCKPRGLLLVVPRQANVLNVIPSAVIENVPIGLLFADTATDIVQWCDAMSLWYRAAKQETSYVSLAMNTPYFLSEAAHLMKSVRNAYGRMHCARKLFANDFTCDDLLKELSKGPTFVTYLGHSSLRGWSGYRGISWRHIASVPFIKPCGTIVSISCDTLKYEESRESFGSLLITHGRACAYLGSAHVIRMHSYSDFIKLIRMVTTTYHPHTIGELMVQLNRCMDVPSHESEKNDFNNFRLIGNPLQKF